jgi:hypothetical protein
MLWWNGTSLKKVMEIDIKQIFIQNHLFMLELEKIHTFHFDRAYNVFDNDYGLYP